MPTVLITRPRAAAERLAEKLKLHGFDSVIEPLLEIEPLENPMPDIPDMQAVMITSANALGAYDDALDGLFGLPCFCVGAKTAERARAAGFQNVQHSNGDGADLAHLIGSTLQNKVRPVLHIAAQDADSKAQAGLERLGYRVMVWQAYAAKTAPHFTQKTAQLLEKRGLDAVLLFSARTAEVLKALMEQNGLEACCESLSAIGLSGAVADVVQRLPWRDLAAATAPTEDAVIECLQRLHP